MTQRDRRRYEDACAAAHAMDIVGDRWALPVMRELFLGPRRFGALKAALPGLSANVLTQRLEELEAAGVITRRKLPPPASAQVYELTPWGYESEPIFQALGRWAARSPAHDPTLPFSTASLFLSFRTMFDPARSAGERARLGFRVGDETVMVRVEPDALTFARGPLDEAQVVFTGSAEAVGAAVHGGQPFEALARAGMLTVEGDLALARRFTTWFPLPPKAPAADAAPAKRARR